MPYDPAINGVFDDEEMLNWYFYQQDPTASPDAWLYFRLGGEPDSQGNRPTWEPGESCEPNPPLHANLVTPTSAPSIVQMVAPGMPFAGLVGRNNSPVNPNYPGDQPFNSWHDAPVYPPPSQYPANHYIDRPMQGMPALSRLDALYDENTPENQAIRTSANFGGGNLFSPLQQSTAYILTAPAPPGVDPADESQSHLRVSVDGSPLVVQLYARRGHPLRLCFYIVGPP